MTERVGLTIDGRIARIVMSNPGKHNALTYAMFDQLAATCGDITDAARAGRVRVAVLRGDGGRAFAAGTDISEFTGFGDDPAADGVEYEHRTAAMLSAVAALPVPLIAAVEGPAVGNGLALALCCDLVIAREDATFGAPVARTLGNCLSPAVIGRLYAAVGRSRGLALLMTASIIDAAAAAAAGLVTEVVPRERFSRHIDETAARIAALAPRTLAAFKEADRRVLAALAAHPADDISAACYGSEDFRLGVDAFLARRAAEFTGR